MPGLAQASLLQRLMLVGLRGGASWPSGEHGNPSVSEIGSAKTWTLDSGLDYGLD